MLIGALMRRAGLVDGVSHERMHESQRRVRAQKIHAREHRSRGCLRPLLDTGERGRVPTIRPIAQHGHGAGQGGRLPPPAAVRAGA